MLPPSDFAAQVEFSGLWVLFFGYWLMNVGKNVISFEWPVTDTIVQYSVITTIYIFFYEKPPGDSASMSLKWLLDCILLWEHIVVISSFVFFERMSE